MDRRTVQEYAGWYASYTDDPQGRALIECLQKRVNADDALVKMLESAVENTDGVDPKAVIEFVRKALSTRKPVVVKRDFYEWTA